MMGRSHPIWTDGPPPPPRAAFLPRPVDPGPRAAAPTIGVATRERLAASDARHHEQRRARDRGADARWAFASLVTVVALATGRRWFAP